MIRVYREQDGHLREGGVALAVQPGFRWVDLEAQTPEEVAWLGESFRFHPLALEDCLHLDQRAKLEAYDTELFLVLHELTLDATGRPQLVELHAFLTREVLVTVHEHKLAAIDTVRSRLTKDPSLLARGPDLVLHQVADALVDGNLPALEQLLEEFEEIEEGILNSPGAEMLEKLLGLKRSLLGVRRALGPSREVFFALARGNDPRIQERTALYFRDVHDHAQRIDESLDMARELLSDVMAAYRAEVANVTNLVMKRLTVFGALMLPLTFLTGFFGMNFAHLPFEDDRLLFAALTAMLLLPAATVAVFKFFRWV